MALSAAAEVARREKKTARALLATEKAAVMSHRRAVRVATATMVAGVLAEAPIPSLVRRTALDLQHSLYVESRESRLAAREAGRARLEGDLERDLSPTPHALHEAAALDEVASSVTSTGLAAAWGAAALAIAAQDGGARDYATLSSVVDGRLTLTVMTETARTFNDEREAILVQLGAESVPPEHDGGPRRSAPGAYKVWSAILDGRTCSQCFAADGEIAEMHAGFKAGAPPLHPRCRCIVEHVVIPKPERLEDIGIDYALFKEELRDVIREQREISDRHALAFVSESLGPKRSPEVLTKRFREGKYRR